MPLHDTLRSRRARPLLLVLLSLLAACGDGPSGPPPPPANPLILFVEPPAVLAGDPIAFRGSHFGDDPSRVTLTFDGAPAAFELATDSLVEALVPDTLPPGPVTVSVTVAGAPSSAAAAFDVVLPPAPPFIRDVTPDTVLGGDTLRIAGRYFGADTSLAAIMVGNRPGGILALSDSLVVAAAPRTLAGTFPLVFQRSFGARATSRRPVTVVPPVAGSYVVVSALAAPDSCGRGEELRRELEGGRFSVGQRFTNLTLSFMGHAYTGGLVAADFEDRRSYPGTPRSDLLQLTFTFTASSTGAAVGALEVSYAPADRCNFRLAMFASKEPPASG